MGEWFTDVSSRAKQVLRLASQGKTDAEIAEELGISINTIATYWSRILQSSNSVSRTQAVARALMAEAESYRNLVELSLDAIWILGGEVVIYANEAAAELFGMPLKELIGLNTMETVTPEVRDIARKRLHNALAGKRNPPYHMTSIRPDGKTVYFEVVSGPIEWEGERGVMVAARDRTVQFLAERKTESLRSLVEFSLDAIGVVQNERLIYANEAASKLLGIPMDQMIGMKIMDTIVPADRATAEARWLNAAAGNTNPPVHFSAHRPGGEVVEFEVVSGPIEWEGKPAVMIAARDRTELYTTQKQAEFERDQLEAILEAVPDRMYRLTREGVITSFRPDVGMAFNPDPGEFVGMHYSDLGCTGLNEAMACALAKISETNRVETFTYTPTIGENRYIRQVRLTLLRDGSLLALVRPAGS